MEADVGDVNIEATGRCFGRHHLLEPPLHLERRLDRDGPRRQPRALRGGRRRLSGGDGLEEALDGRRGGSAPRQVRQVEGEAVVGDDGDDKTSFTEVVTSCTRRMNPCFFGFACESKYFRLTTSLFRSPLKSIASSVSPRNVNTPNLTSSPSNASIALPSANLTNSQYSSPASFRSTMATIARPFPGRSSKESFLTALRRQSFSSKTSSTSFPPFSPLTVDEIASTATSNSYVSACNSGNFWVVAKPFEYLEPFAASCHTVYVPHMQHANPLASTRQWPLTYP